MEVKQNLSEGTGFSYWRPFLADDTMGIDLVGVIFPISFSLVKCLVLKVKGWVLIIKNCCVKITILKKEERKRETWMEELWTKRIGNLSLHKSRNVDTFTFNGLNLVEKRYPKLNVVHVWETSRGRETLVRFVRWNRMDKVEQSYSWLFNYLPPPLFCLNNINFTTKSSSKANIDSSYLPKVIVRFCIPKSDPEFFKTIFNHLRSIILSRERI